VQPGLEALTLMGTSAKRPKILTWTEQAAVPKLKEKLVDLAGSNRLKAGM